ncbi:glycosyltransferase family 2 protein [Mariniluteicoccus flavus]
MTTTDDTWAWAHEEREAAPVDVSHLRVTAVLVAHNAAVWLAPALRSLAGLTTRPARWLAVDNGSDDATGDLLRASGLFDLVVDGSADEGFGQAVARALAADAGGARADDHPDPWLWLLHDDVVAEPDTLHELLAATVADPDADVLGPKLLQPGRGERRISELGVSIADSGRRVSPLTPGEIDQGQHTAQQVLGVSTCGMLIRRAVWDELGGLAPELPVFRDGVDLGWRATAAGHRVVTAPEAVLTHRRAGREGLRASRLIGDDPDQLDRALALRTVAARGGRGRLVLGSYARALGFLLAKAPSRATAELRAVKTWRGGPASLTQRVRPATPAGAEALERLRPGRWAGAQAAADEVHDWASNRWQEAFGEEPSTSLDELTGDDFAGGDTVRRGFWTRPVVLVGLLLTVLAVAAGRGLVGAGHLVAPGLLPARDTLGEAWRAYLAPIPGAPGLSAPPWEGWVALGSTLAFGQPEWFTTGLALFCVPLAYASAQLLLRREVASPGVRLAAGAAYALAPALLGGLNRGQLGLMVVAILLPPLAVGLRGLALRDPGAGERWRAAFWAGLVATVTVSFHPVLLFPGLLAALVAAVVWRRDRVRLARVAIAVAVPLVLLAPWWPAIARGWTRLVTGPDAGLAADPWAGLAPWWLWVPAGLALAVLALAGLARRTRSAAVWAGWAAALIALAIAVVLASRLATGMPFGTRVRPDTHALVLLAVAGLVLAAARGLDGPWRVRPLAALAGLLAGVVLVASAGWWAWASVAGPVKRDRLDAMPPFVRVAMNSPAATRTLALDFAGAPGLRWSLVADDQLRLGDADRGLAFGGSKDMQDRTRSVVARLVAGAGDEQVAGDLARLGVAHVWVRGATEEQRARITNVPGLGPGSGDERGLVWTVPGTVARLAVTAPAAASGPVAPVALDGRPGAEPAVDLPAGRGRTLTVAEPTDARRVVTFDGERLEPRTTGGATTYAVPDRAGRLAVAWHTPVWPWVLALQLIGLLAVVVLAAPSWAGDQRRRARARAASEPVGRRAAGGAA